MKINAVSIRPGNVLEHNGRLCVVSKIQHTQPGKGGAYMQVEMKCIKDNIKFNERFRSSETVEKAHLDTNSYQYLYKDEHNITVMDTETYEQHNMSCDLVGDPIVFLQDGMMVSVVSYQGQPVSVELPETAIFEIIDTEPVVKGQTAASSNKPAKLDNGARTMVPPFIGVGDRVVIRLVDAAYLERAKE